MFTVGEFARIAQVSKRTLRYYDEVGLLKPIQIDSASGYRLYSAEQLPQLNRILALKELGLSLDQIRRMLDDNISTDEMQGMLLLKKSEIEQQLLTEMQRIRKIESRLQSIRDSETQQPLNVIMKETSAQPVMSLRTIIEDFDHAIEIFGQVRKTLPTSNTYSVLFCICYSEVKVDENMDMEIGCLIGAKSHLPVVLNSGLEMSFRKLPAVETMATTVVKGAIETIHMGYARTAQWAERNGYRLAGIPREITLQLPTRADGSDLITEIQTPVAPVE